MKYNKYILLLVLINLFSGMISAHPIKMSTGKLVIDTHKQTCQLTLNFFIDDFEEVLRNIYPQPPFNYDTPDEMMIETIQAYVFNLFELNIDGIIIPFNIETIERIEDNVCQVNFAGKLFDSKSYKAISVKNALLFPSFDKQSNILHLLINKQDAKILQFYPSVPLRKVLIE